MASIELEKLTGGEVFVPPGNPDPLFPFHFSLCWQDSKRVALPKWEGPPPKRVRLYVVPRPDGKFKLFRRAGDPEPRVSCGRRQAVPLGGFLKWLQWVAGVQIGDRFDAEIKILEAGDG